MAEFIAATVSVLLEKAIAMAADRFGLMLGFYDDLKEMEGHAKDIQALLADAEAKQSKNTSVLCWLRNVEEAAFEAENVLDELLYESLCRQVHGTKTGAISKVCSFFSMKHDMFFRVRMGKEVRLLNKKLKDIKLNAHSVELVRLLDRNTDVTVEAAIRFIPLTHSLPLPFVAGRSDEESKIVDMLLLASSSDENDSPVSVLPIVGMGGLGKTTLAKSIYNNERISSWFSKKIWICVSDEFDVTSILKGILESLKGERVVVSSVDAIVHGIQQELIGERFLFVLDDVWNEDKNLWDSFFASLVGLNPASGSCCVLTTRLHITGNLVSTFFNPFVLGKLSDDACWQILCQRATKGGEMLDELNIYREQILKRGQGVPLALNVIGSLLSLQRKEDWLSIVKNKILKFSESVEGKITSILKLSYDYLPSPHIKKCFVYCSVYPKDSRLDAQELIELWMAEGFLQESEEKTMEEVGAAYLQILVQSSLLEKGNEWYQMHDLVHDLAESIALGEKDDLWNARSAVVEIVNSDLSDKMLLEYRQVRVLRLFGSEIVDLPNAFGKLKHLHYLDLSFGEIKNLPESVCQLYNLQTLRLYNCHNLQCLPLGLSNLINLRHLHFYSGDSKLEMPPKMGRLTCLQTLYFFNVMEKNDGRGIEELGSMRNLKGNLVIRNLELVKGKEEARMANLFEKQNLTGLELEWHTYCDDIENCDDEPVLEGLEPCPTLQRLSITSFMGIRFPQWLGKLSESPCLLRSILSCQVLKAKTAK